MTSVKICGMISLLDAQHAAESGADMVGCIVGPGLEKNSAAVNIEKAQEIFAGLNGSVKRALVITEQDLEKIILMVRTAEPDYVQVHLEVSVEEIKHLKKKTGVRVIKTVHVRDQGSVIEAQMYAAVSDLLLLDTATKQSGHGGTGETHDWNLSRQIIEQVSVPCILAGGLTPENVQVAIEAVHPWGVDVRSGVSNTDGSKDLYKVAAFVANAKVL